LGDFELGFNIHPLYLPGVLEALQDLKIGATRVGVAWCQCSEEKAKLHPRECYRKHFEVSAATETFVKALNEYA
jgi:hypothetical protein